MYKNTLDQNVQFDHFNLTLKLPHPPTPISVHFPLLKVETQWTQDTFKAHPSPSAQESQPCKCLQLPDTAHHSTTGSPDDSNTSLTAILKSDSHWALESWLQLAFVGSWRVNQQIHLSLPLSLSPQHFKYILK